MKTENQFNMCAINIHYVFTKLEGNKKSVFEGNQVIRKCLDIKMLK